MADERDRYLEEMGRERVIVARGGWLAWQWERLEAELRGEPLPEEEPPTQEEELF